MKFYSILAILFLLTKGKGFNETKCFDAIT